jgi:hypothetical protein
VEIVWQPVSEAQSGAALQEHIEAISEVGAVEGGRAEEGLQESVEK